MNEQYEIYVAVDGRRRVNIGDASYALEVPSGSPNQHNVAAPWRGDIAMARDETLRLWLTAAVEVGVPLRYAWRGIINSLGQPAEEMPPWKPKHRDWFRCGDAEARQS